MRSSPKATLRTSGMLASLCLVSLISTGCPDQTFLSGLLDVGDFVIAAGESQTVDTDLTIRANGFVLLDGDLIVAEHRGQSITIEAEGDIVVSGRIIAGNGLPAGNAASAKRRNQRTNGDGDGGDITLTSRNGNIIIVDGSQIVAGNGADGTLNDDGITGGAGCRGGDVILSTPNGSISLPQTEGAIHLGNGGRGSDVALDLDAIDPTTLPEVFENAGGRSGLPLLSASSITGTASRTIVLEVEFFDVLGQRIGGPGDEITVIDLTLDPNPFSGGVGGNAGNATVEPIGSTAPKGRTRMMENGNAKDAIIRGAEGATGWFKGGDGANVRAIGGRSAQPGSDGGNAIAFGGNGGVCSGVLVDPLQVEFPMLFGCTGGRGGSAFARGGNGTPGGPGQVGGAGGSAHARAGGSPFFSITILATACGDATAEGGNGGPGGDACEEVTGPGGAGGAGGPARAEGPLGFVQCPDRESNLSAIGGDGKDGGDSNTDPGDGGNAGEGKTSEERFDTVANQTQSPGVEGASGGPCPDDGGGDDDGNGGDDDGGDTGGGEQIIVDQVITSDAGTVLAGDCDAFDGFIGSIDFMFLPEHVVKQITVRVEGSNPLSRSNVLVKEDIFDGGQFAFGCGFVQGSNVTEVTFTLENAGAWFIAVSDIGFISDSYRVTITIGP